MRAVSGTESWKRINVLRNALQNGWVSMADSRIGLGCVLHAYSCLRYAPAACLEVVLEGERQFARKRRVGVMR